MNDNKTLKGNLMNEGILVWAVFMPDGKVSLYMDGEKHMEKGGLASGTLLSPDISAFHNIFNLDNTALSRHFPEQGVSIRYRMRLRYVGSDDAGIEQSEIEPETCFPAWAVQENTGRISLYLQELSEGKCFISDMAGLPGLPDLHPGGIPVKFEMLVRQAYWNFDRAPTAFLKISRNPECLKKIYWAKGREGNLMEEGVVMWAVFTKDGKAALYMDGEGHLENGISAYGEKLSHDVPVLHEICNLKDMLLFRHFPEHGVAVRIRMRIRFPADGYAGMEQPEHGPETCFHAWLAPGKTGCISLYLNEPAKEECVILKISGLLGLPTLQSDSPPVRVEMLVQTTNWFADMVGSASPKSDRYFP